MSALADIGCNLSSIYHLISGATSQIPLILTIPFKGCVLDPIEILVPNLHQRLTNLDEGLEAGLLFLSQNTGEDHSDWKEGRKHHK